MTKVTVSRSDIISQVVKTYTRSVTLGGVNWYAVIVSPDGAITELCAGDRQKLVHDGDGPRSVVVWSAMTNDVEPESLPDPSDASWLDWFDLNVPDLADILEPAGVELED